MPMGCCKEAENNAGLSAAQSCRNRRFPPVSMVPTVGFREIFFFYEYPRTFRKAEQQCQHGPWYISQQEMAETARQQSDDNYRLS